jgi:AcrR family transcriptional regulator
MTATTSGTSGRRRGRPPKSDAGDTKELLLQAALALFAEKGFEGTSVRDIARSVGLSESVLYAHFDSKRAIFDAVFARLGPLSATATLNDLLADADADPPGVLRSLIERLMTEWSSPAARRLISLMSHDNMIHSTGLREGITASLGGLAEVFARWIAAGRIDPGLGSPGDLAYALIAPVALLRVLWLHDGATPREIEAAREQAARHGDLFIRALFR